MSGRQPARDVLDEEEIIIETVDPSKLFFVLLSLRALNIFLFRRFVQEI